ncbi:MAG: 2,3-bisphosphoglycerate-independent phosphoglycerate mutase [Acholeplasmatales bacterium]|nr:2,3-bisphosphoglycerate-independent phosphoglycerate mutase [Acholeplasmatales bacterium]
MKKRPVMLIIMDGYGLAPASNTNAVSLAKKPNLDRIFKEYDMKTLNASGDAVGLPEGQMGNSEVGHMNLGAGRVVRQSLSRINYSIKTGEFNKNEAILNAIKNAKDNNKKFHIFGLCSDGGIHSHTSHIIAIAKMAHENGIENVYYHAFMDGRDTAPTSGKGFLEKIIKEGNVKVATVGGRYYGMDRDKNFDRIQVAYDAMTLGDAEYFADPLVGMQTSYDRGKTDEFVVPFVSDKNGMIEEGDSIVFANFRPDRAIQIATAFSNPDGIVYNPEKPYKLNTSKGPKSTFFVSMMKYADQVKGELAFGLQSFDNLYGDVISANGMTQLRIAETEKYAHVTFFFDGGADRDIKGADRILVNSPKVATYDLKPEMSAYEVCDKVVAAIEAEKYDTIILNFANCDMVGHTGVIEAAVKAVEAVDDCIGKVINALDKVGGVAIITADHGNAEKMADENGNVYTAHTTNPVPVVITDKNIKIRDGILSDITPTLLELLGIEIPADMTSKSLIVSK